MHTHAHRQRENETKTCMHAFNLVVYYLFDCFFAFRTAIDLLYDNVNRTFKRTCHQ